MRSDSSDSNINLNNIRGARTKELNKKNNDDDYDSDFTLKNNKSNLKNNSKSNSLQKTFTKEFRSKSRSSSRSSKRSNLEKRDYSMSPVSKKKNSAQSNHRKKSYSSRSQSRSRSRSRTRSTASSRSSHRTRSRETYQIKDSNKNNKINATSFNNKKPNGLNYGNGLAKKNKIQSISANNTMMNGNRKKYSGTGSNLSKNSSESYPANLNRNHQTRKNNSNKHAFPKSQASESLNQTVLRLVSAQRLKNNDLQNKITELNHEIEKLKDENKILKRVHHREEIAIKRFESHDTDVSRLVKNHTDEIHSLKETIKNVKNDNRRLNSNLIDKEEEIRSLKKKNEEFKKILNDKKLFDSLELSKKLEQTENNLAQYKTKAETLERKLEMIEKNHKHEIGVEMAHHKETQKNFNKLNEEFKELKVKFEEKERALDMANIYSRNIKENITSRDLANQPGWKASTQSLNSAVNETPRDKRKQYDKKRREEAQKKAPEIITKLDSPKQIKENKEKEDIEKRKLDIEMQIKQQEEELKKKDAIEKAKRLQREKEDEEKAKKLKDQERKAKEAAEYEKKKNAELEELKKKEKEALEEEERKKRWISENTIRQQDDKISKEVSKKDELLAKLSLIDNDKHANLNNNQINENNELKTSKKFETNSSLPPKPSSKNEQLSLFNSNDYKFSQTVENLHDGKPASSTKESNKNELLNKLFGNNISTNTAESISYGQTKSNSQQSKLDKVDDIFNAKASFSNKKEQQQSSKVNLLPWEIDDLNFNVTNQRGGVNKLNNSNLNENKDYDTFFLTNQNKNEIFKKPNEIKLERPKLENKLIFSSNQHKNNNAFVEDIEELVL